MMSPRLGMTVLILLVAAVPREIPAAPPETTVTYHVAGKTDLENRLARPVTLVRLREPTPMHLLGRLAWLYGVDVFIDSRAGKCMGDLGETSIDVQGGDALNVLEAAAPTGMRLKVQGEKLVLHRQGDRVEVGSRLARIGVQERPNAIGHHLEGRVVDARGRPVAGALVASEEFPPARTDANGRFRCRMPQAGGRLQAWAAGRLPSKPVESSSKDLRIRIGPLVAAIVVRPIDAESGKPVHAALVRWESRGELQCSGPSRENGQVEIRGLAAGNVSLRVAGAGHGAGECTVPIRTGEVATVTIRLPEATLAERLQSERVDIKVDEQPLARELGEFAKRAAIPIRFAPSFLRRATRRPVSVEHRNATLGEALKALCDAGSAKIRIDEAAGLIWIEAR